MDLIMQLIKDQNDKQKDQNDKLDEILTQNREIVLQTTKTNGRVDNLSKWKDSVDPVITELNNKSNVTKGRDGVIWVVILAIVGVLWWVAQKIVTIQIPIYK